MNQTEYSLLSKEDIFKMYENVCDKLDKLEKILDNVESEYSSLQGEFEDLQYEYREAMNNLENYND